MTIETRPESEAWRGSGGEKPLHLSHSNSPIRTVELDLDSLNNAGFEDVSFVEYPLAEFAAKHRETIATIYAHETQSTNFGDLYYAAFFGVVGSNYGKILEILKSALQYRLGVPNAVIKEHLDHTAPGKRKIRVRNSPDSIAFKKIQRAYHIEDGRLWAPYEMGRWYTNDEWSRTACPG